jgi:hypothetical protein
METITLKINPKTKKGQVIIEFLKQFVKNDKSVEIIKLPNEETIKAIHEVEKGKTEKISLTQFREQLR